MSRKIEKYEKDEKYRKVSDHYHYAGKYRSAAYSICILKHSVPKKTSIVVFHNGANYDYHCIIKELAVELE